MTDKIASNPEPQAGAPGGLCVLVVEDDEADAYLIKRALAAQPNVATVVHAVDGVDALRLVESGEVRPDLAFIDLHMPRKNGFNLLAALSGAEAPRFPMVVLTSSTAPTDAMRSRLRGATRVVTKPDNVKEMELELRRAIALARPFKPEPPSPEALRFPARRAAAIDEAAIARPAPR